MAMTSSNDDAAITKVGIPCTIPKPFCCRVSSWGTTTAGVTAPRTNLIKENTTQSSIARCCLFTYYMGSSVSGQDESNPALWLATQVGKMELSCPHRTTRHVPQEKFPGKPYNKSSINQACSVKMAGFWNVGFLTEFYYHFHCWELTVNRLPVALSRLAWVICRLTGVIFSLTGVIFRVTRV